MGPARRRRVLVVDDSPFIRQVVGDVIRASPDFEVAGEASDGREAIRQLHALAPDLLTLDVQMPVLDGLATLGWVMREAPCPVVMLSALDDGGDTTMRALELGAVDFVRKPALGDALDRSTLEARLLGALRAAAGARLQAGPVPPPRSDRGTLGDADGTPGGIAAGAIRRERREAARGADGTPGDREATDAAAARGEGEGEGGDPPHALVLIAASTGGPRALAEVVPALAGALASDGTGARAAIVIAQHMPAGFTESLARRLDALSPFAVREARDGALLCGGRAYVAPGGRHTTIRRDGDRLRLSVSAGGPVHGVAPAADLLFASAVDARGVSCVAVVLTGMGQDGARGSCAVRAAGGRLVVQDAATSVVHGMPLAAAQAAGADVVAPLQEVADAVLTLLGRPPAYARSLPPTVAPA